MYYEGENIKETPLSLRCTTLQIARIIIKVLEIIFLKCRFIAEQKYGIDNSKGELKMKLIKFATMGFMAIRLLNTQVMGADIGIFKASFPTSAVQSLPSTFAFEGSDTQIFNLASTVTSTVLLNVSLGSQIISPLMALVAYQSEKIAFGSFACHIGILLPHIFLQRKNVYVNAISLIAHYGAAICSMMYFWHALDDHLWCRFDDCTILHTGPGKESTKTKLYRWGSTFLSLIGPLFYFNNKARR